MPAWWTTWSTYTLSDFLLFSAWTYHRLFELYNVSNGMDAPTRNGIRCAKVEALSTT